MFSTAALRYGCRMVSDFCRSCGDAYLTRTTETVVRGVVWVLCDCGAYSGYQVANSRLEWLTTTRVVAEHVARCLARAPDAPDRKTTDH